MLLWLQGLLIHDYPVHGLGMLEKKSEEDYIKVNRNSCAKKQYYRYCI